MSLRARGERPGIPSALPFTSVHTYSEAESLMVRLARLKKDNSGYTVAGSFGWRGELEDIDQLAAIFEAEMERRKER